MTTFDEAFAAAVERMSALAFEDPAQSGDDLVNAWKADAREWLRAALSDPDLARALLYGPCPKCAENDGRVLTTFGLGPCPVCKGKRTILAADLADPDVVEAVSRAGLVEPGLVRAILTAAAAKLREG